MTSTPAGWYPDPDPAQTADSRRVRYWDGSAWTEHVSQLAPDPAAYPQSYQPQAYQPQTGYYAPGYGYPQAGYPAVSSGETTPDGAPLASWGQRLGAYLLDGVIAIPVFLIAATPVVASQWDSLSQWFDSLQYAADNGTADPPPPALLDASHGAFWALTLSIVAAQLIYQFVFLTWKQATPGKLILGLRVRLRERSELPAGAVLLRLLGTFLLGLCWIGGLLDYLWPLWDDKKQALHDKLAKTNVVKVR